MDQIDIFGDVHEIGTTPAQAPRSVTAEQPRLFEPQYEGQLWLADNPDGGENAVEKGGT